MTREEAIRILASSCIPGSKQTEALETLIPELRESEDERTRKEIIEFIRSQIEDGNSVGWDRWIAYLEKQKEQKPAEWSEEDERKRDGIIQWLHEYQKEFNPKYDSLSIESIESLIDWLKSLRPSWKPSEDELAKRHLEGYIMGREDTMREMKDFIESHFSTQSGTSTLKAEG